MSVVLARNLKLAAIETGISAVDLYFADFGSATFVLAGSTGVFTATTTTTFVTSFTEGGTSVLEGSGADGRTKITLTELNDTDEDSSLI